MLSSMTITTLAQRVRRAEDRLIETTPAGDGTRSRTLADHLIILAEIGLITPAQHEPERYVLTFTEDDIAHATLIVCVSDPILRDGLWATYLAVPFLSALRSALSPAQSETPGQVASVA